MGEKIMEKQITELSQLEAALKLDAVELLTKRHERLKGRYLVLFPWLRIKWLLRKVRIAQGK